MKKRRSSLLGTRLDVVLGTLLPNKPIAPKTYIKFLR